MQESSLLLFDGPGATGTDFCLEIWVYPPVRFIPSPPHTLAPSMYQIQAHGIVSNYALKIPCGFVQLWSSDCTVGSHIRGLSQEYVYWFFISMSIGLTRNCGLSASKYDPWEVTQWSQLYFLPTDHSSTVKSFSASVCSSSVTTFCMFPTVPKWRTFTLNSNLEKR